MQQTRAVFMALKAAMKYIIFGFAHVVPRFHTLDFLRVSIYRFAGLRIGPKTRISGPLIIEFSFRRDTINQIEIGEDSFIGYHCRIAASKASVTIGSRCNIGPNVSVETAGHWFNKQVNKRNSYHKAVRIGDNVWIGTGCILLPGVSIGENAIVAAGAVVARDVEKNTLVGGVPARPIKSLDEFET